MTAPREEVRLADGALEATFVPDAGMLCCSLRHEGDELLSQNSGVDAYASAGATMALPLLFPWANRLAGFAYEAAGRTVEVPHDPGVVAVDGNGLPIHGVVPGNVPWRVVDGPLPGRETLAAELSWGPDQPAFEVFPFEHDATYDAELADSSLTVSVALRASSSSQVPVCFGFHPYIQLPGVARADLKVEVPAMKSLAVDDLQIPTGASSTFSSASFPLGDRVFDDGFEGVAPGASFAVAGGGREVRVEFTDGYPFAQIYAPAGRELICFEPMTAPANALVSGTGLRVLSPGEEARATFAVVVRAAS